MEDGSSGAADRFTSIERVQRSQQVREQLEAAIERGDYGPGERIPSERELSELLNVSRVSVREAVASLEALGILEVHQGRGAFVAASPSDRVAASLGRWVVQNRDQLDQIVLIRGALDELAAECAAVRAEDDDLAEILRAQEAFAREAAKRRPSSDALVDADIALHVAIADASGLPLVAGLLHDLHRLLRESRKQQLSSPGRTAASVREHELLVAALKAREPVAVRAAMAKQIGPNLEAALESSARHAQPAEVIPARSRRRGSTSR